MKKQKKKKNHLYNKTRLLNRKYVDEVKKPWQKNASVEFSGKTLIYALRIFLDPKISEKIFEADV